MSQFQEKLKRFIESQRGKDAREVQSSAHKLSQEIQQYAPKERWGNIFKYVVAYALGIGLGHALAAALTRGVDELAAPAGLEEVDVEVLAHSIETDHLDQAGFETFLEEVGIHSTSFESFEVDMSSSLFAPDETPSPLPDNGDILVAGDGITSFF